MTSIKRGIGSHKIWGNFAVHCGCFCGGDGVLILQTSTRGNSKSLFSIIYYIFQQWLSFDYIAHMLKPVLQLIFSSIMERVEVHQPFVKVGLAKFCFFSCQFYYTYKNSKYCVHQQRKKSKHHNNVDLLVELFKENDKTCP